MTGEEIYEMYQSKRDYSGSEEDQYAQFLNTMWGNAAVTGEIKIFYSLVEKAHEAKKKLAVDYSKIPEGILYDEYFMDDLFMV